MKIKPGRFLAILILTIIIALLQTGCRKKTVTSYRIPGDGGLLSQKPCGPPCFYGITPGVTNRDEAEDILISSMQLENCRDHDVEGPNGMLSCDGITYLNFTEANLITGIGYYPEKEITVNELIQEYGEPDYVAILTQGYHNGFTSSMKFFYLKFFNLEIEMSLYTEKQEGSSFTVSPETIIDEITYSIDKVSIENNPFIQEWKGYGEYFMGAGP